MAKNSTHEAGFQIFAARGRQKIENHLICDVFAYLQGTISHFFA